MFNIRLIVIFLMAAFVVPVAYAQQVSSLSESSDEKKSEPKVGGMINLSRSSSLYDFNDGSRRDGMDYMAMLNFKINEKYTLRAQGGYSQDLKYSEAADFSDISINISRSPSKMGKSILMGYRLGAGVPTSKDSHSRQSLLTSLTTGINLAIDPERLLPGLEISGSMGLGRNIHQYETALDGRVNTQSSAIQAVAVSYGLESGLSISGNFSYRSTWSYQGVMRNSFEMTQEIGYQINKNLALSIGHSNSGSALKPNGSEYNIEAFDDNNSIAYASTTLLF
jgi:hypothetical protein